MVIFGSPSVVLFLYLVAVLIIAVSVAIPVYGYARKRWKGLAKGCLLQLLVCAIAIVVLFSCALIVDVVIYTYERDSAMVTVKTVEPGTVGSDTLIWYLKPDEECITDCMVGGFSIRNDSDEKHKRYERYDIIRIDSASVCVEDRIVVNFDFKNQKVTATNYDEPIEVVGVDWEKVNTYFGK